jgi:hypothetical protein
MTKTLTKSKVEEHSNDLPRAGQRRRRRIKVRRVALISPEGAHFKLRPIRGSLEAAKG